jgi:hypothetical protein
VLSARSLDPLDRLESKVRKVLKENSDLKVNRDHQAILEPQVQLDLKVIKENRVSREQLVHKVLQERLDHKDQQVQQDRKGQQDLRDQRDRLDSRYLIRFIVFGLIIHQEFLRYCIREARSPLNERNA